MNFSVLGLGIIGTAWAKNLSADGVLSIYSNGDPG